MFYRHIDSTAFSIEVLLDNVEAVARYTSAKLSIHVHEPDAIHLKDQKTLNKNRKAIDP